MSETTAPEGTRAPQDGADEEVVPDYSRVGFRALQALCKDRGLPGDGNSIALIERLKNHDLTHGREIDLSAAENLPPDEEVDLLSLDDDEPADAPESPVGDGGAASVPSPTGAPTAGEDVIGVGTTQPAGIITGLPTGSSVTPAAPAVAVRADPAELPSATTATGRVDLTVKNGIVKVGEGNGASVIRAFRKEFQHGPRGINDVDHFAYIAETHAAAWAQGLETKGGATVGARIGEGVDGDGRRTLIYQVSLKRQR